MTTTSTKAKDLTKEAPASPSSRVGGYVILARMADKARAEFLGGNIGEYHTNCPLDHYLLDWKGISYDEIKKEIVGGADDEAIAKYLDTHGKKATQEEVAAWSDSMDKFNFYDNPEKRDWYVGVTKELGLEAASTPVFKWLEADDKVSF